MLKQNWVLIQDCGPEKAKLELPPEIMKARQLNNESEITIFVDADACPVKDEVLRVAARHDLRVCLVSNQWLRLPVGPRVEKIVVGDRFDEADDWIADHIDPQSIAITADIPLAKRCLDAGGSVIGPNGKPFIEENISMAMAMREINAHRRETGESKGYNAAFTRQDRSNFLQALEGAIQKILNR